MKTRLITGVSVSAFVIGMAVSAPAYSQASPATEIGKIVGSTILKAVLGKGLDAIFGNPETGLTKADLADAISNGFDQAARAAIEVDVDTLARNLSDYTPSSSYEYTSANLDRWRGQAADIQSQVKNHMSRANFMEFVPSYITATNTRLALIAEKRRSEFAETQNDAAAEEANQSIARASVEAIRELAEMFKTDFNDNDLSWKTFAGGAACVYKNENTHFYAQDGTALNNKYYPDWNKIFDQGNGKTDAIWAAKNNIVDISTKWCPTNSQYLQITKKKHPLLKHSKKTVVEPDAFDDKWQALSSSIYQIPHHELFAFTYKKQALPAGTFRWVYSVHPTLESAQIERAGGSANSYPEQLGDIRAQFKTWFDLVVATGSDAQKLTAAKYAFVFVDAKHLAKHAPGFSEWYHATAVPEIMGRS